VFYLWIGNQEVTTEIPISQLAIFKAAEIVHKLSFKAAIALISVTEFWKINHMVALRIFEFSMALLIAETTFKNISELFVILGINDLLQSYMGRN